MMTFAGLAATRYTDHVSDVNSGNTEDVNVVSYVHRPPAARWYARVVAELSAQRRTKNWLHKRTGVARTTIDGWETQPKPPQARTVALVAEALGISEGEAFALAGLPTTSTVPADESGRLSPTDLTDVQLAEGIMLFAEELRRRSEERDESVHPESPSSE
jgi:transcriptional regulator with XRE-family HTH domain